MRSRYPSRRACALLAALSLAAGCGKSGGPELLADAESSLREGDYRAALIDAKNYVQGNPKSAAGRLLLGRVSLAAHDSAGAARELRIARELGASPAEVDLALGHALLQQREFEAVLSQTNPAALAAQSERAELQVLHGDALFGLRRYADAQAAYAQALQIDARSVAAIVGDAQVLAVTSGADAARARLRAALAMEPGNPGALLVLGGLQIDARDFVGASRSFARVREGGVAVSMRQRLSAIAGQAESQLALGDVDGTVALVAETAELAPDSTLALYLQAKIDFVRSNHDAARDNLSQILAVDPDNSAAKLLLGAVSYSQGNLGQADMYLSSVLAVDPDNSFARKLLAETHLRQDKPQKALQVLKPGLESGDAGTLALAALASMTTGDLSAGLKYLEQSASAAPQDGPLLLQLSSSLVAAGQPERALQLLERVPAGTDLRRRRDVLQVIAMVRSEKAAEALAAARRLAAADQTDPFYQSLAGAAAVNAGDLRTARTFFGRAVELAPDNAASHMNLARVDLLEKNPAAAIERLERALQLRPDDASVLVALAQAQLAQGDSELAASTLERARSANPRAAEPRLLLSQYYLAHRDVPRAELAAREATQIAPEDPVALNLFAMVLAASGKSAEGVQVAEKAAGRAPESIPHKLNLARLYLSSGRIEDAQRTVRDIIRIDPNNVPALVFAAALGGEGGSTAESRELLANARKLQPDYVPALILEGDLAMRARQYAPAAQWYHQANQKAGHPAVVANEYWARRAANIEPVLEPLTRWLEEHPHDLDIRVLYAQALQDQSERQAARDQYELVVSQRPDHVAALNNFALLTAELGNRSKSVELAARAYTLKPDVAAVADTYGWLLVTNGDHAKGTTILREAVRAAPQSAEIRYHLAAALARSGKDAEALMEIRKVVASPGSFADMDNARRLLLELEKKS